MREKNGHRYWHITLDKNGGERPILLTIKIINIIIIIIIIII